MTTTRAATIDASECTEPQEAYNDPDKVRLPDFRYKHIDSVKACFQAAGWRIDVEEKDDNTWGDGAVLAQFPAAGTDVDPKNMDPIELQVSTGNPPQ